LFRLGGLHSARKKRGKRNFFSSFFHLLLGNWQEELELWGQLLFRIQAIAEVQPANSAVGVQLHSERLDVIRTIRASREVREVELNLVPPFVEPHRHGADERLDSGGRLVVGGAETSADARVIEYLHFEREVLVEVLDDHDEERQLDAEGLVGVGGA